jgi:hypothetical protein
MAADKRENLSMGRVWLVVRLYRQPRVREKRGFHVRAASRQRMTMTWPKDPSMTNQREGEDRERKGMTSGPNIILKISRISFTNWFLLQNEGTYPMYTGFPCTYRVHELIKFTKNLNKITHVLSITPSIY